MICASLDSTERVGRGPLNGELGTPSSSATLRSHQVLTCNCIQTDSFTARPCIIPLPFLPFPCFLYSPPSTRSSSHPSHVSRGGRLGPEREPGAESAACIDLKRDSLARNSSAIGRSWVGESASDPDGSRALERAPSHAACRLCSFPRLRPPDSACTRREQPPLIKSTPASKTRPRK